jgi:hypothetical protein
MLWISRHQTQTNQRIAEGPENQVIAHFRARVALCRVVDDARRGAEVRARLEQALDEMGRCYAHALTQESAHRRGEEM